MPRLGTPDYLQDLSLDSPRAWRPRDWAGVGFVVVVLAALTASAFAWGDRRLEDLPTLAFTQPTALALICALTSYLLFNHVSAHPARGYIVLASGYLIVATLLVLRALSTQDVLLPGRRFFGGDQTAAWTFVFARLSFAVFLLWAISQFIWDRRQGRSRYDVWSIPVAVSLSLVGGLGLGLIAGYPGLLPDLADAGEPTTAMRVVTALQIAVTTGVAVVATVNLHRGSFLARWLFVVSLMLLADALISTTATSGREYGWYLQLFMVFMASTLLLCALIWQLARLDRALERLVRTDPLTGLASRQELLAILQHEMTLTGQRPVVALWLDLDGFKMVNDRLGHSQGDAILSEISRRLADRLTDGAVIGRLGGDEFGVVIPDSDVRRGHQIAQELKAVVEEPITHNGVVTMLSATFGVAAAPRDADRAESLLQRADEAMYVGKSQGRSCVTVFEPRMEMWAQANAHRRHELAQAIVNGELTVWFQPILDGLTGSTWGCEALVRWNRGGQFLPAIEFLPFAVSTGQIREIGLYAAQFLRSTLPGIPADIRHWHWTVNLSAPELAAAEVVDAIRALILAEPRLRIVIEITEGVALRAGSPEDAALVDLQRAGALIAIDDFGSGFANFGMLERLQPEIVKIDRSLVIKATDDNSRAQTFVAASIAIAHSLGARVVAEGVEDERTRGALVRMGADLVQGYLLGRPAPLSEVLPDRDADVRRARETTAT